MVADKSGREAAARFAGHSDPRVTATYYIDDSKLTGPAPSDALPRLRDVGDRAGHGSDDFLGIVDWL